MQNKKVTMLAAVLAVTIIAMAGVGYAAVTYKATTTNPDNTLTATDIVLTLGEEGTTDAYTNNFFKNFYYDTDSALTQDKSEVETIYTPIYDAKYVDKDGATPASYQKLTPRTTGANAAIISNDLTLNIAPENVADSQTATLLIEAKQTVAQSSVAVDLVDKVRVIMVLTKDGQNQFAEYSNNGWTFPGLDVHAEASYTVTMLLVLETGAKLTSSDIGFGDKDTVTDFVFTLTAEVSS